MERFHLIKKLIEQIDDVYDLHRLTFDELDEILDLYSYKKILEERIRVKKKKQGIINDEHKKTYFISLLNTYVESLLTSDNFENLDDTEIEYLGKELAYKTATELRKHNDEQKIKTNK